MSIIPMMLRGVELTGLPLYSHSIVDGGFELTSYTTRLIPRISFMIRVIIRVNRP